MNVISKPHIMNQRHEHRQDRLIWTEFHHQKWTKELDFELALYPQPWPTLKDDCVNEIRKGGNKE